MGKGRFESEGCWRRAIPDPLGGLAVLALLAAGVEGCRPDESRDVAFQRVLPLCNQYFGSTSSPGPPGSDASRQGDDLSRQIREHAAEFDTPAGVHYLLLRLQGERDEAARACIRRLLDDLREGAD